MDIEALYGLYKAHPRVTTDSRQVGDGGLFFALHGERFDGNDYAHVALEGGCVAAVVDRASLRDEAGMMYVEDSLQALQALARRHRRTWGGRVLGITGSNGKTTTKELVAAVLGKHFSVLFTQGNLNNSIGVPLTLLRLGAGHDVAVVEMGASHIGDIRELVGIAEPDCGLITNVGRAHLEGFGSEAGVLAEKGVLYDWLRAKGGYAFVNAGDARLLGRAGGLRTVCYGRGDVEDVCCDPFLRFRWRGHEVRTQLVGAYNVENVLAALTVGEDFGVGMDDALAAVAAYAPSNGRSQLLRTRRGNVVVMDAYNANASSMVAAVTGYIEGSRGDCDSTVTGNRLCILGDMKELGTESAAAHRSIVEMLSGAESVEVWLVGEAFASAAKGVSGLRLFANAEEVAACLRSEPVSGRMVLVKGSHSMGLYTLSDYL